MGDDDGTDGEDMSGYEKPGVQLTWLDFEDPISVSLHTGSGGVPAISAMVNWLAHAILLSPSFSWWFTPSPLTSLCLYHHLRTRSWVIPIYISMQWSWIHTEYSIHRVLHHPKIDCLLLPASFSSLGRPCCTQHSTFPRLRVNQWIESQLPSYLPLDPYYPQINHLQLLLQCRLIMASKGVFQLSRSWPPSTSLSYTISASKCISELAQSRTLCLSLSYTISAFKCIS